MTPRTVLLPAEFQLETGPRYPLRGHQLGYRPKTNSYDGWDLAQWERYIRDLAVFGTNAIELIPPRSDDDADSPHFPRPPMEMMVGMSRSATTTASTSGSGTRRWTVTTPTRDRRFGPAGVGRRLPQAASDRRRLRARRRPRPHPAQGADGLAGKAGGSLRRHHPKARCGSRRRAFDKSGSTNSWRSCNRARLAGRRRLRAAGPHRACPSCARPSRAVSDPRLSRHHPQPATASTPSPTGTSPIALTEGTRGHQPPAAGPGRDLPRIRRPYDRLHHLFRRLQRRRQQVRLERPGLGPRRRRGRHAPPVQPLLPRPDATPTTFAQGLLALERNWRGPLLTNAGVETTLAAVPGLEAPGRPQTLLNWRFQQALYRAYYDAYVRDRLIDETALEAAGARISSARPARSARIAAHRGGRAILDRAVDAPSRPIAARVFELAEALFQSIRMQ